jgi:tRNA dimethylallyltransferase
MLPINIRDPLLVIVGPTAVGKTELAVRLAEKLDAEIVSADSRLFYTGMDIGTAKPSPGDQKRVPHHLIDIIRPDEEFSLAMFQAKAYRVIDEIIRRGKIPIMVGGTGQYIHAVLQGWKIPTQKPDEGLRKALTNWGEQLGAEEFHRKLSLIDPAAAALIETNNVRRTVRAFEVIFGTGKRFSEQRKRQPCKNTTLVIGLTRPRDELYQRVDQRIVDMLAQGLIDEVKSLIAAGYSPELPSLSAIGYRDIIAYIQGKITLDEAVVLMKRLTRRYIRHQANWFKPDDASIHWFTVNEHVLEDILQVIENPEYWSPGDIMGEELN